MLQNIENNMPDEFIKIRTWVTEHAQSAYHNEDYIEAIQVLHGWIENNLQEILILTGSIDYNVDIEKTWGIAN
jgi:hypothetical protein